MENNIDHYIVHIEDSNIVEAYDTRRPYKSVLLLSLKEGYYLGFLDKNFIKESIENQFSEILYEDRVLLIRHKDIVERIIR